MYNHKLFSWGSRSRRSSSHPKEQRKAIYPQLWIQDNGKRRKLKKKKIKQFNHIFLPLLKKWSEAGVHTRRTRFKQHEQNVSTMENLNAPERFCHANILVTALRGNVLQHISGRSACEVGSGRRGGRGGVEETQSHLAVKHGRNAEEFTCWTWEK